VVLLVVWAFVIVKLITAHPLPAFLALAVYAVFDFGTASYQRLRTGRRPTEYQKIRTASDMRRALAVVWREMRTYQMWLLILMGPALTVIALV